MEKEIYIMDGDVEISEAFSSIEEVLEVEGTTSYQFIDLKIDGEEKRLVKGIDY